MNLSTRSAGNHSGWFLLLNPCHKITSYPVLINKGLQECKRETPNPLSFAYPGMCIALGQHKAIAFNIYPADEARHPMIAGKAANWGREFFVKFYRWLLRSEARPGYFYYFGKGRYAAARRHIEHGVLKVKDNES